MTEAIRRLLHLPFMPHGMCYLWNAPLVWLNVISDLLIALAYLAIPIALIYFIRRRRDVPFGWMFWCFGVFISACGATHANRTSKTAVGTEASAVIAFIPPAIR